MLARAPIQRRKRQAQAQDAVGGELWNNGIDPVVRVREVFLLKAEAMVAVIMAWPCIRRRRYDGTT